jgi:two-component system, response regulator PdtaR
MERVEAWAAMRHSGLIERRVLVVEDELLVAMELERLLRQAGCTVLGPVPSIERALALIRADPPEVGLLDVNLGGRRVTPVAEALAARGLPFILVTSHAPAALGAPILAGAPLVGKPFTRQALVRALSTALGRVNEA